MNITNKDFEILRSAVEILPHGDELNKLSADERKIIISADTVLIGLIEKKKRDNKRISGYIADKRKVNKNYARGYKK